MLIFVLLPVFQSAPAAAPASASAPISSIVTSVATRPVSADLHLTHDQLIDVSVRVTAASPAVGVTSRSIVVTSFDSAALNAVVTITVSKVIPASSALVQTSAASNALVQTSVSDAHTVTHAGEGRAGDVGGGETQHGDVTMTRSLADSMATSYATMTLANMVTTEGEGCFM